jgi:hypothetical protein
VIGIAAHPSRTLSDRVLERLALGPETSAALCDQVLGLAGAPAAVADRLAVALLGPDPRVRQLTDGRWSLVAEAQGSPLLEDCAFAVVDVETTGSHRAGGDAWVTAQLLGRLLALAREAGARTLADLAGLEARKSAKRKRRRSALPTEPLSDSCPRYDA